MTRQFTRVALGGLLLTATGLLHAAPIWTFSNLDPNQNSSGGKLSNLETTFDTNNDNFTWSYTVRDNDPKQSQHNGFWLVVNNGGNPKGQKDLAILYGDLASRDIVAYAYNGENGSDSWKDGKLLAAFDDAIKIDRVSGTNKNPPKIRDISFTINVGALNDPAIRGNRKPDPWTGVSFDDELGIWFHAAAAEPGESFADFNRRADGSIKSIRSINFTTQGWVDTDVLHTTNIPEPGVLYLSALGLAAFGASRRLSRGKTAS